jgi:hypothetical protein
VCCAGWMTLWVVALTAVLALKRLAALASAFLVVVAVLGFAVRVRSCGMCL